MRKLFYSHLLGFQFCCLKLAFKNAFVMLFLYSSLTVPGLSSTHWIKVEGKVEKKSGVGKTNKEHNIQYGQILKKIIKKTHLEILYSDWF